MALLDDLLPQLEKIALSLDLSTLLHPVVIHFLMALPVLVLLLELMNLMLKKKAVGGVSFLLIILTVVAAIGAYATGLADGKAAELAEGLAKTELLEHKLLGSYLMLGSVVILLLKLLAMTGNKIFRGLYLLALIGFVVVMVKQGNEGGELVYEHGVNVASVKTLDDKIFDLEDALEDAQSKIQELTKAAAAVVEAKVEVPSVEVPAQVQSPVETTGIETLGTTQDVQTEQKAVIIEEVQTIPAPQ